MKLLLRWLIVALAILSTPYLVSGVRVDTLGASLAAAAVLLLFNTFLKPILVFLTFPITVVTLGLFLIVINALLFYFMSNFVGGVYIASFWSALWGSLWVSFASWLCSLSVKKEDGSSRIFIDTGSARPRRQRDLN